MAIRKASAQGAVQTDPPTEISLITEEVDGEIYEGASRLEQINKTELEDIIEEAVYAEEIPEHLFPPPKNTTVEAEVVMISVSRELYEHYQVIIDARDEVLRDHDASASGKAAILNTTTSMLREIAKLQQDLFNSDLIARLQQACYHVLKEADPALKDKVLALMEKRFEEI